MIAKQKKNDVAVWCYVSWIKLSFTVTAVVDYQDLRQTLLGLSSKDLEQRRHWYSSAAVAYDQVRPRYPQALIDQVVEVAQLSSDSKVLEIGCGPATATVAFAPLVSTITCLEPNPDFYQLAQKNCCCYVNVDLQNTFFEEWPLEAESFHAVLAATSFHWIPPDIGYAKAAQALQPNGVLVLLWNEGLQPSWATYKRLLEVYQAHAPSLARYEDRQTQEQILQGLGQMVTDSKHFKNLVSGSMESEVTYTTEAYLMLLNTYSSYLTLDPGIKASLFQNLRQIIDHEFEGQLSLSYVSAFHIAQKG